MVRLKPLLNPQQLRTALAPIAPRAAFQPSISAIRASSSTTTRPAGEIPSPTPFVPDVQTFLTVIGRGLSQHASKFPTWEALFSLTSDQLRELGVEPPRTRRYLLQWRQRFRLGQYGIGGDLQHVEDGKADLRILESDRDVVNPHKYVVNVPAGRSVKDCSLDEMSRVRGYKVVGAKTIVGPYALPLKGGEGVRVSITEGMWEDRRGHKIDGGERRRTEVRYKKRIAERREMRERGEL
ncbi:IGR protein motif-domain-containing protein [Daldinia loculata]|uniref:IGR protein motif-domain-containing protein n=1 Tax=Daldinia loculata TaxID=103429 RepID=UPI0020C48789|nr:IGR protein motif-domain-containing protein [Daldinia loculata]KAI1647252.1 IGR protein motif-domain-containing protein [Daldinia loculata]KAI2779501.1 IGR protein motif-domain-containing protein [Daldinia loculata]